jgi:glycosyltransferase involved in cell wall biosynthesis
MRLVFVTQRLDPAHPALAATIPMLRALAARVDEVTVLTHGAAPGLELPANCRVRTFGAPTQVGRGARFAWALGRELARGRPGAVVAHMCPIYAILAAPLARPLRVPVLLWFTHWRRRRKLELAHRLATRVLTVDATTFPFASDKVVPIGHAIDVDAFPPSYRGRDGGPLRLLMLGRYSPSKRYEAALRAAAATGAQLTIHGPQLTPEEEAHRRALERLNGELGEPARLGDAVTGVLSLLREADVLVNATAEGSADKVVFEAACAGVPVLWSAPAFAGLLPGELRFGTEEELRERLAWFEALPAAERERLGAAPRAAVAAGHSVGSWADAVLALSARS